MNNKKIIILVAIVIIIVGIGTGIALKLRDDNAPKKITDAEKFKEEYESLNDTIRQSDGARYNNVTIPEKNPIKYLSSKEAVDVIKNQKGIVYLGANWCPWCRNAVEVLFESAKDNGIETIYYVNLDKIRNVWEVKDGQLVKTQQEEDGYYDLLAALDDVLDENTYTITSGNEKYDTGEKRIYMPLVIAVKDGKIIAHHESTVKLNENQTKYSKLTPEQHDELLDKYNALIQTIK